MTDYAFIANPVLCKTALERRDNRIQDLQKEIESYEEKMRKIPISERLPEEGRVVLLFRDFGCPVTGERHREYVFFYASGNDSCHVDHVKFWMPIPNYNGENDRHVLTK